MTTIARVFIALFCFGVTAAAQNQNSPVLACNLKALGAAERPRYDALMKRVRAAVRELRELRTGYALSLDEKAISLVEVAEWMAMERKCCPFLRLRLSTSGNDVDWHLDLTGPAGVKALLEAEMRPKGK